MESESVLCGTDQPAVRRETLNQASTPYFHDARLPMLGARRESGPQAVVSAPCFSRATAGSRTGRRTSGRAAMRRISLASWRTLPGHLYSSRYSTVSSASRRSPFASSPRVLPEEASEIRRTASELADLRDGNGLPGGILKQAGAFPMKATGRDAEHLGGFADAQTGGAFQVAGRTAQSSPSECGSLPAGAGQSGADPLADAFTLESREGAENAQHEPAGRTGRIRVEAATGRRADHLREPAARAQGRVDYAAGVRALDPGRFNGARGRSAGRHATRRNPGATGTGIGGVEDRGKSLRCNGEPDRNRTCTRRLRDRFNDHESATIWRRRRHKRPSRLEIADRALLVVAGS